MNPVDNAIDAGLSGLGPGTTTLRRRLLKQAGLAAGVAWVGPIVATATTPVAAASANSATITLYKAQNSAPPTVATVCNGSFGAGNATRGTVVFRRRENPTPTIYIDVVVTSGPTLTGTCPPSAVKGNNARDVFITQADANGNCLATSLAGCYNGPNDTLYTFSAPIVAGAVRFSMALTESGGGGTDTYWTFPLVSLP